MKTPTRLAPLAFLSLAVGLVLVAVPARAASIDGTVEWQGINHLPIQDRSPLVPLDGEAFAVRIRTWRNDVEDVKVVHDVNATPVDASVVGQLGPYDIWEATIPASSAGARVLYSFELRDGADVDHYTLDGASDLLPTDADFVVDFSTLEHAPRGATPHPGGGTVFRVWAPNATSAYVRGSFNGWGLGNPMTSIGGGDYVTYVANASINQRYKFFFGPSSVWAPDLYGRIIDEVDSNNNVIFDPTLFTWSDDAFVRPALEEMVIYQLHMGTFSGGTGDPLGVPSFPSGFRDAEARVGHLVDLGVNAVMLNPVMEFPGEESAGYNPMSQFAPERTYGAPNDLKRFIDTCHAQGIAVLLDIVWNHQSISNNVYWNYDGAQSYFDDPPQDTPWGSQLDLDKPEVRDHLIQSMHAWFEEYHFDGFRMDATDFMNYETHDAAGWSIMQRLNDEVDNRWADRVIIAEQLPDDDFVTRPTSIGGAGFDAQYFDAFTDRLREQILTAAFGDPSMWTLRDIINGYGTYLSSNRVVNYVELHDEAWATSGGQRLVKTIDPDFPHDSIYARGRTMLAQGFTMLSPGIPAMLQGTEWLESIDFGTGSGNRIDWSKKTQYAEIFAFYQDLIGLRTTRPELRADAYWQVTHVNDPGNVIGWRRGLGDSTLMVVANFSNDDYSGYRIGVPVDQNWAEILNSQDPAFGGDGPVNSGVRQPQAQSVDGFANSIQIEVPAMSISVFERASDATSVDPIDMPTADLASQIRLLPGAPNPSTGLTNVRFRLPARDSVRMTLHDVRGRRVRLLLDAVRESGEHDLRVDTRDLANGTYFVRMRTQNAVRSVKLTVTD